MGQNIEHIEGKRSVDGVHPYWWAPRPGDTECEFGIKKEGGSYHLENLEESAPVGSDDEKSIGHLLSLLWNKHQETLQLFPDAANNPAFEPDIYIRLAAEYGVTLEP
ncbi:MAG: hypothetical protein ACD_48C00653G0003 [uncultured bacterium]|nr:MAG: hypothetical protein ACD_48C00653G0003 [uncultured bacterium]